MRPSASGKHDIGAVPVIQRCQEAGEFGCGLGGSLLRCTEPIAIDEAHATLVRERCDGAVFERMARRSFPTLSARSRTEGFRVQLAPGASGPVLAR
jgi:hypothetical protein